MECVAEDESTPPRLSAKAKSVSFSHSAATSKKSTSSSSSTSPSSSLSPSSESSEESGEARERARQRQAAARAQARSRNKAARAAAAAAAAASSPIVESAGAVGGEPKDSVPPSPGGVERKPRRRRRTPAAAGSPTRGGLVDPSSTQTSPTSTVPRVGYMDQSQSAPGVQGNRGTPPLPLSASTRGPAGPTFSLTVDEDPAYFITRSIHTGQHDLCVTLCRRYGSAHRDFLGRTPLHHAAQVGAAALVERLLTMDTTDVGAHDSAGRTPLSLALEYGRPQIVQMLRSAGAREEDEGRSRAAGGSRATGGGEGASTADAMVNALLDDLHLGEGADIPLSRFLVWLEETCGLVPGRTTAASGALFQKGCGSLVIQQELRDLTEVIDGAEVIPYPVLCQTVRQNDSVLAKAVRGTLAVVLRADYVAVQRCEAQGPDERGQECRLYS